MLSAEDTAWKSQGPGLSLGAGGIIGKGLSTALVLGIFEETLDFQTAGKF